VEVKMTTVDKSKAYVLWFKDVGIEDVNLVGGKAASLGEMIRALTPLGIQIPDGFAITSNAYWYYIDYNNLREKIKKELEGLNIDDVEDLERRAFRVRELIKSGQFPPDLEEEIRKFYYELGKKYGMENVDVAVRSSSTAEDLPEASFAGQQETYLNIVGAASLLVHVKKAFASLFTARAIAYREKFGFNHFKIALAIAVQKMVRSDLGASGVMFTLDTETGFRNVVLINAIYGLGEMIVGGHVVPDEYLVFKPTLKQGYQAIIEKKLGKKDLKMVYGAGEERTKIVPVPLEDQKQFALTDEEILTLADWGIKIEEYYSKKYNRYTPMDIEWAKDGQLNQLFVVQARPETVHSRKNPNIVKVYKIITPEEERRKRVLVRGIAVGDKIGVGKVRVLRSLEEAKDFKPGEVLVTDITDPDWEPIMRKAAAIVTNRGGRTAHAAIVARELGIPAVVGTGNATEVLKTGQLVTVSCAEGEVGYVYDEKIDFEVEEVDLTKVERPKKTKILVNVANPNTVFKYAYLPVDGVGLAREEFIINNYIKIHPLALLHFEDIKELYNKLKEAGLIDPKGWVQFRTIYAFANGRLKEKLALGKDNRRINLKRLIEDIEELTFGYEDKITYYIKKLSYGVAKIAAAFYPNPVIVRFSDFKSNEYANLIGGQLFEPEEENPMLGFRGAARYYSKIFKEAFGMEVKAMLRVRNKMGLKNAIVMIPFCRTPEEGTKVLEVMKEYGLDKEKENLQVYVMAELPSNVFLADKYAEVFDGFSIGSNDLTQLVLGLDRDSGLVAYLYDERNPAVKRAIEQIIKTAKQYGRKVGICGQAPSDFPEFAAWLVEEGIDTISVNPDAVLKTIKTILKKEKEMGIS
jgi:pyruvate,water dikinase